MRIAVFDTEANGLVFDATKIWVLSFYDMDTKRMHTYTFAEDNIRKGLVELSQYDMVVAHNGKGYDEPLIRKLYPDIQLPMLMDTMILSSLMEPDRSGGHALATYGEEFGIAKLPDLNWQVYSAGMIPRCEVDVQIGVKVWEHYRDDVENWKLSVRLEHKVAELHAQQCLNGVGFNREDAEQLWDRIAQERNELDAYLIDAIPPHWVPVGVFVRKPFVKSGGYAKMVTDWCDRSQMNPRLVWGTFTRIIPEPLNPNSYEQIKSYLLANGWQPTAWNYKKDERGRDIHDDKGNKIPTSPKLTEDSFDSISGDVPRKVARRAVLSHRLSILRNDNRETGWLYNIRSDGRIEAGGFPQGTPTGRYRHTGVVNVPKADGKVPYGIELRSLFIGDVMVGTDASALEACIQGHYTFPYDNGTFAKLLLEGDIHTHNMPVFGVDDRQAAKTPYYGVLYGAQPDKLASILGIKAAKAKRIFDNFWRTNKGLGLLRQDVIQTFRKLGYIRGLDGRKLFPRSEHSALNMLFQSAGSIVVKTATCFMWQEFEARGLSTYVKQVLHMHDEIQFEVREDKVDEVIEAIKVAWKRSGEFYKLNVPISGDVKVGRNWAETH